MPAASIASEGAYVKVLVTGATGYVGGRLVPALLEAGHRVRVLARDPQRVQDRGWAKHVEVVQGDLLDADSLVKALRGVDAAYYLVHSMGQGGDFAKKDREAAQNFVHAAARVKHVVYLGGLVPAVGVERASSHLQSRSEVGAILAKSLPVTEFRAGPVIGSGSSSFEMLRYLTERLPAMVAPRWVSTPISPIAIRDVISYLAQALDVGPSGVVEIGMAPLTFKSMMSGYAEVRGLRRAIVPVPVLTPRLAGLWVQLVTPVPNRIAIPLIKGIVHPLEANTERANALFPTIYPLDYPSAVRAALKKIEADDVVTRWSDATNGVTPGLVIDRGFILDKRARNMDAGARHVYEWVTGLGGERGWGPYNWAWTVRGAMDRLLGGPGVRRGRRDPNRVQVGDAVDFWRVEAANEPNVYRLRAEMKLPGRAWLEWRIEPHRGGARVTQTAAFAPRGLWGHMYWYALTLPHALIFSALLRWIDQEAASRQELEAAATVRRELPIDG